MKDLSKFKLTLGHLSYITPHLSTLLKDVFADGKKIARPVYEYMLTDGLAKKIYALYEVDKVKADTDFEKLEEMADEDLEGVSERIQHFFEFILPQIVKYLVSLNPFKPQSTDQASKEPQSNSAPIVPGNTSSTSSPEAIPGPAPK